MRHPIFSYWHRNPGSQGTSAGVPGADDNFSADFYVSQSRGSDAYDGLTRVTAKSTIAAGLALASAGQVVGVIDSSTYRQSTYLSIPAGVTLKAQPGETPIISRAKLYTSWSKTAGQTNIYESAETGAAMDQCYQDTNVALTLRADLATLDAAAQGYYFDATGDKLYVNLSGADKDPASHTVEAVIRADGTTTSTVLMQLQNSAVVDGLTIRHSPRQAIQNNAATATPSTVKNCTIEYHLYPSHGHGIHTNATGKGLISQGNVFRACLSGITMVNGATVSSSDDRFTGFASGSVLITSATSEIFTLTNVTIDTNTNSVSQVLTVAAHWSFAGSLTAHNNSGPMRLNVAAGGLSISGWHLYDGAGLIHNTGGPLSISSSQIHGNTGRGILQGAGVGALTVDGCSIYNNTLEGVSSAIAGAKILRTNLHDNGTANLELSGANALVELCDCLENEIRVPTWNIHASGANATVRLCRLTGKSTVSLYMQTGATSISEYNVVGQRVGVGGAYAEEHEGSDPSTSQYNVLFNDTGGYGLIMKKSDNGAAQYNVVIGTAYNKGAVGVDWLNNYIKQSAASPAFTVEESDVTTHSSDVIFTGNTIDDATLAIRVLDGEQTNFASDNNHFVTCDTWAWRGTTYNTLADWRTASGGDAASDTAAPSVTASFVAEAANADANGFKSGWIVVHNWAGAATVTVDLSSLTTLTLGNTYRLQNALNNAESTTFVYNGSDVSITMADWTTDAVSELYPHFGAFVIDAA